MPYTIATPAQTSANKTGWSLKKSIASCSHKVGTNGLVAGEAGRTSSRSGRLTERAEAGRQSPRLRLLLPQHLRLVEDAVRPWAAGIRPDRDDAGGSVVDHPDPARPAGVDTLERDERVLAVLGKPLVAADAVAVERDLANCVRVGAQQRHL